LWTQDLLASPRNTEFIARALDSGFAGTSPIFARREPVGPDAFLHVAHLQFSPEANLPAETFLQQWRSSLNDISQLIAAEFQITGIRAPAAPEAASPSPIALDVEVRYELVGTGANFFREQRIGGWSMQWTLPHEGFPRLLRWKFLGETRGRSVAPAFVDQAQPAFAGNTSFARQLLPGVDHWRTVLDGACGIDIYGHNGVSVGDIDGDGFDDLYVCQPAGLPNRLFRNRGDGTFEDVTERSGVGLLDSTVCALFADIDNDGQQDLIVVCGNGPLLFINHGGGKFRLQPDAFQFAAPPQGTFTGAAIADYDRDGWLDIYFCLYSFYQGSDQYRYPCPYYAAENGPPNFLMRNHRDGTFRDVTSPSGLSANNTRFSFCCAWGDAHGKGWPDLYVVNDFGRKNLYRNNGDGTFTDIAAEAGAEDVGAGMSACWRDFSLRGRDDLYVANMWTAAGLRVSQQDLFQKNASEEVRAFYHQHAMGNSLLRAGQDGKFSDQATAADVAIGRWAWSSDAWDFDHDGFPDLYVTNGMISGPRSQPEPAVQGGALHPVSAATPPDSLDDLNSFFWRQVVAKSPLTSKPTRAYELGWNAINELIRADGTWSGYERNIAYRNNGDGTFSDVSALLGLDFLEDGRTFALADFDHDGRVECVLKNRSGPQLRFLKNIQPDLPGAIAFRLQGTKSNRDAIGASVTLEASPRQQTLFVQAGSGFLAQHSKELFFGLGAQTAPVNATIHWPSGLTQRLEALPPNHRIFVTEGSPPSRVEPFRATKLPSPAEAASAVNAASRLRIPERPAACETWLLVPITAPDFSAQDLSGKTQTLLKLRGSPVLLYFLTTASPECPEQLAGLQRLRAGMPKLSMLVIIAEESGEEAPAAQRAAMDTLRQLPFPGLPYNADVTGIYNLLFRSLFDRHRDMPLPSAFLLDEQGAVVKIYSGAAPASSIARDVSAIPRDAAARLARALPFPGVSDTYAFSRSYLSFGSAFYDREYLAVAEDFLKLAVRDDPDGAEAYYGLGSVYLQQQRNDEARQNFAKAAAAQQRYPGTLTRAWNNLGLLAGREGRTSEAIEYFERALQADPDYEVALVNLGNAYRQGKQPQQAQEAFERALALNPDDPEANYGLGMISAQRNDSARAEEFLTKALAARPVYPEALNNLGILYLLTNRKDQAEKSFEESIRVAPAFDQSYLNLARLYAIDGQPQKARTVLQDLLKQHPGHPQAQELLSHLPQ
jgi:Tfp pilus assembly protein PilF/peroxiredoxin